MVDRFSEMAERVQLNCESYAMRSSIDGRRRVIADALRAAHKQGTSEALADRDARIVELETQRKERLQEALHDATKAQLARVVGALRKLETPRPLDEYHDDYGSVLWWLLPVNEPPYVGAPGDSDWPGYHTHWTKCPQLKETEDHA